MQYLSIMIPKLFMGNIFLYLHLFFNIVYILTLESFLFFYVRLQGTTKEAFVVDAIQLTLEHCQLFTHQTTKVVEATTKYCTNMGLLLVHPPWRNNYRYSFNARTHQFCIEPLYIKLRWYIFVTILFIMWLLEHFCINPLVLILGSSYAMLHTMPPSTTNGLHLYYQMNNTFI